MGSDEYSYVFDGLSARPVSMYSMTPYYASLAIAIPVQDCNELLANIDRYRDGNGDLDKAYGQLGRLTYEEKRTGADNALLIDACLTEIDGLLEDIQGLTAEISAATGEKICPHCAESVPADAAFCPKCGARMDAEPAAAPADSADDETYFALPEESVSGEEK